MSSHEALGRTASRRTPSSVVIGLDSSDDARVALAWAADEAQRRGVRLRIGHSWNTLAYQLPDEYQSTVVAPAYQAGEELLETTAADLRNRYPELVVDTELLSEPAVEGLVHLSEDAQLLVVGRRGLNPFLTTLLGSVSQGVVAHAPVTVVVVPGAHQLHMHAPDAAVVVGVAPGAPGPVEFAFAEAELRGVPLRAVRTWMQPPGYIMTTPQAEAQRNAEELKELEGLLVGARRAHPTVHVTVQAEPTPAEEALVGASTGADLVVLGAHRRHSRFGLPIGRVPHRVLHLAHAPVAVVRN